MSNYRVAHRYATALLESAKDEQQLETIAHDAELIGKTVRENRELRVALASPVIEKEKKKRILAELFQKKVGQVTYKFLDLLVEKDREGVLLDIVKEFTHLLDHRRGIVRVEVGSAVPLADGARKQLQQQLEMYTGKKVILDFRIDPTLLGGFAVRLEDRIIDASIIHQLELLREKFLEGSHVEKR